MALLRFSISWEESVGGKKDVWFSTRMLTSLPGNWSRRTLHLEELYSKQNQSNCSPRNLAERTTSMIIPLPIPIGLADQACAHLERHVQELRNIPADSLMHDVRVGKKFCRPVNGTLCPPPLRRFAHASSSPPPRPAHAQHTTRQEPRRGW